MSLLVATSCNSARSAFARLPPNAASNRVWACRQSLAAARNRAAPALVKCTSLLRRSARPGRMATGIGFQPTGGGKAAITGDFVLTSDEVNRVIKALRANGVEVTALHSHMLDEQPRLFFMHFWANDDAIKLARGLRAALDKMANAKT